MSVRPSLRNSGVINPIGGDVAWATEQCPHFATTITRCWQEDRMSTCRMMKDRHGLFVRSVWTALWLGVLLGISTTVYAQEVKLVAQDGTDGDAFGIAVSSWATSLTSWA